jgi:5'-deoxynucleotidase YfbR-like HD superfamily hydrolase
MKYIELKRIKTERNTTLSDSQPGIVIYKHGMNFDFNKFVINYGKDKLVGITAQAISKQPRYNGNTGDTKSKNFGFYSVAQHSVRMSEAALLVTGDIDLAMACLLHDVGETFIGDVLSPIKALLPDSFKNSEKEIDTEIFRVFNIDYEKYHDMVKIIDVNICDLEMSQLLYNSDIWNDYWTPEESYEKFTYQYKTLVHLKSFENKKLQTQYYNHKLNINDSNTK